MGRAAWALGIGFSNQLVRDAVWQSLSPPDGLISNLFLEDFGTGPQVAWRCWVDHKICVNRANVIDQCGCTSADPAMEIAKCAPEQVEDSESHSTAWRMIGR